MEIWRYGDSSLLSRGGFSNFSPLPFKGRVREGMGYILLGRQKRIA